MTHRSALHVLGTAAALLVTACAIPTPIARVPADDAAAAASLPAQDAAAAPRGAARLPDLTGGGFREDPPAPDAGVDAGPTPGADAGPTHDGGAALDPTLPVDRCADGARLVPGVARSGERSADPGGARHAVPCLDDTGPVPMRFFSLRVPPRARARVAVTTSDGGASVRVGLFRDCSAQACLTSVTTATAENPRDVPLDLLVGVLAWRHDAPAHARRFDAPVVFDLRADVEPMPALRPTGACALTRARALNAAGDRPHGFFTTAPDADASYALRLDAPATLVIDARADALACVRRACDPSALAIACTRPATARPNWPDGTLVRAPLPAGDYDVVIAPLGAGATARPLVYDVHLAAFDTPDARGCASVPTLAPGVSTLVRGPQVYALDLAERSGVSIDDRDARVCVRTRCADEASTIYCTYMTRQALSDTRLRLTRVLDAGRYFLVVYPTAANYGTVGPWASSLTVRTAPAPASSRCATAPPLGTAQEHFGYAPHLMQTDLGGAASASCEPTGTPESYYRLVVPPGHRAVVHGTAVDGAGTVVVRVRDACDARTCALHGRFFVRDGGASFYPGFALGLDNRAAAPREYVVSASAESPQSDVGFSLRPQLIALPAEVAPNATCARATPLAPGARLTGIDLLTATEPSPHPSYADYTGRVLYYAVVVPPGRTVEATATSRDHNVFAAWASDCDALARISPPPVRYSPRARPIVARFTNGDASPRVVILEAGGLTAADNGRFDLAVDLVP